MGRRKRAKGLPTGEQAQSIGFALAVFDRHCKRADITKDVLIKSFTAKFDGTEWLIILRGQKFADSGLVQFGRLPELVSLPGLLNEMTHQSWKADKYG